MSDIVESILGRTPEKKKQLEEAATRDKVNELIGCCTTDAGKLDRGKLRAALGCCSSASLNKMLNACRGEGGDSGGGDKPAPKKDDDGKQAAADAHAKAKADLYDDPPKDED